MNSLCLIPIVIGITGHQDPHSDSVDGIISAFRESLLNKLNDYSETPIWVLSSLMPGIERKLIDVVIELRYRFPARIKLICSLPSTPDDCMRHWKTEEEEFSRLLQLSDDWFILPNLSTNDSWFLKCSRAGSYLARMSHILVACWDGDKSVESGDIYSIIRERLYGSSLIDRYDAAQLIDKDWYLPPVDILDEPETGVVLHFHCPRENRLTKSTQSEIVWLPPEGSLLHEWQSNWRSINSYNSDLLSTQKESSSYNDVRERLSVVEDQATSLAVKYQKRTQVFLTLIGLIAGLSAAVFLYAKNFGLPDSLWMPMYGLCVLTAVLLGRITKTLMVQEKHLDYRALGEGLRVQCAWRKIGLYSPVSFYYLRKQKNVMGWVRSAIKALNIGEMSDIPQVINLKNIKDIHESWIKDQKSYYERKITNNKTGYKRITHNLACRIWITNHLKNIFIFCGLLLFFLGFIGTLLPHFSTQLPFHASYLLLMTFFPVMAIVLDYYADKQAWDYEYKQYLRMFHIFSSADDYFTYEFLNNQNMDVNRAYAVLLELGKEALQEQGDWYQLHKDRMLYKGVYGIAKR